MRQSLWANGIGGDRGAEWPALLGGLDWQPKNERATSKGEQLLLEPTGMSEDNDTFVLNTTSIIN